MSVLGLDPRQKLYKLSLFQCHFLWVEDFNPFASSIEELEIDACYFVNPKQFVSVLRQFDNCTKLSLNMPINQLPYPNRLTELYVAFSYTPSINFRTTQMSQCKSLVYLDIRSVYYTSSELQVLFLELVNLRVFINVHHHETSLPDLKLKEEMFYDPILNLERLEPLLYLTSSSYFFQLTSPGKIESIPTEVVYVWHDFVVDRNWFSKTMRQRPVKPCRQGNEFIFQIWLAEFNKTQYAFETQIPKSKCIKLTRKIVMK